MKVRALLLTADLRTGMVHCLLHDNVKETFVDRYNVLNRPELDARNSPIRPPSYLERVVVETYNSVDNFSPWSEELLTVQEDFADSINLSLDEVPSSINQEQAKSWLAGRSQGQAGNNDQWLGNIWEWYN
jgi:hypothetical protein